MKTNPTDSRYARPEGQHVKIEPYQMGACDPGQRKTHPAFGMIQFIRSSGGDRKFFGSEVPNHGTTFTVQITLRRERPTAESLNAMVTAVIKDTAEASLLDGSGQCLLKA